MKMNCFRYLAKVGLVHVFVEDDIANMVYLEFVLPWFLT